MEFKRFADFLKEKDMVETHHANREAMDYDVKMQGFINRFPDIKEGEKIVKAAGYPSIKDFLNDRNPNKWSRLRIPGQRNYVGQEEGGF